MIDLENKEERNKLIDDFFNKGLNCNIKEVYQAVVNTVADLEYENEEKTKEINKKEAMYDSLAVDYRLAQEEIERLNNIINELKKGIENMYVDDAGEDIWEYEEEYLYRKEFLDKIEELKGSDKE